ncbi:MAG: hypothetical protein H6868_02685 [Rhodospirillales bacterium]|nr:hypothetical protein [Rhodospirillales bacterium]
MQNVTPVDTRYVPVQQQPYCCCPASIQMVMMRRNIPMVPQEYLGWHLGLTVPPEDSAYFYNPRVSATTPPSGFYGTQVGTKSVDPDRAFDSLGIPLRLRMETADRFPDIDSFKNRLEDCLNQDFDVLLCLRWMDVMDSHAHIGPADPGAGHIVVADKIMGDTLRIVDPARGAKWRTYDLDLIYNSICKHARNEKAGHAAGLWILEYTE